MFLAVLQLLPAVSTGKIPETILAQHGKVERLGLDPAEFSTMIRRISDVLHQRLEVCGPEITADDGAAAS